MAPYSCQNHHAQIRFHIIYTYTGGHTCASYEVTKNPLVNEAHLLNLWGRVVVPVDCSWRCCEEHLSAPYPTLQFLVILQSTTSIFGVRLEQKAPYHISPPLDGPHLLKGARQPYTSHPTPMRMQCMQLRHISALDIATIPHMSPMDKKKKHAGDKEEPFIQGTRCAVAIAKKARLVARHM